MFRSDNAASLTSSPYHIQGYCVKLGSLNLNGFTSFERDRNFRPKSVILFSNFEGDLGGFGGRGDLEGVAGLDTG